MASDTNIVILIGRLTRDAELKYTPSGTAISKFSIAVNESIKKNDEWKTEVSFFDCTLWGKQAESLNQYLEKGKQISVTGRLKQGRWEQDGQARSKIEINVNTVQLLGSSNKTEKQESVAEDFEDDIPF